MKIPVLICDDNVEALSRLERVLTIAMDMLDENENRDQIVLKIVKKDSYGDAFDYITKNNIQNGIYFLDIELGEDTDKNNGIDLAEVIKTRDKNAKIVFVTNYQDMAFLTYQRRIGAVDYIVKSADVYAMQKRMNETLEDIIANYSQKIKEEKVLTYKLGSRIINLNLNKLYYIETSTAAHRLNLVKNTGISFITGSLNKFESENPDLLRISQSCLINPENVVEINISENSVTFPTGQKVKYSRKLRHFMRNWQNKIDS